MLRFPVAPKIEKYWEIQSSAPIFFYFSGKSCGWLGSLRGMEDGGEFSFYYFRGWQMMYVGEGAWVCGHQHTSLFGFSVHLTEADELQRMISCDESLSPSFFGGRRERRKFLFAPALELFLLFFPFFGGKTATFSHKKGGNITDGLRIKSDDAKKKNSGKSAVAARREEDTGLIAQLQIPQKNVPPNALLRNKEGYHQLISSRLSSSVECSFWTVCGIFPFLLAMMMRHVKRESLKIPGTFPVKSEKERETEKDCIYVGFHGWQRSPLFLGTWQQN